MLDFLLSELGSRETPWNKGGLRRGFRLFEGFWVVWLFYSSCRAGCCELSGPKAAYLMHLAVWREKGNPAACAEPT